MGNCGQEGPHKADTLFSENHHTDKHSPECDEALKKYFPGSISGFDCNAKSTPVLL